MSQRNFPPSFWDANHNYHSASLYSAYQSAYGAFAHPSGAQGASYLGHEALYPGLSGASWLSGASALQYPLSSLQHKVSYSSLQITTQLLRKVKCHIFDQMVCGSGVLSFGMIIYLHFLILHRCNQRSII